jgi:hypothetical protein
MQSEQARLDMEKKAIDFSKADAEKTYLEEYKKCLKAELMKEAEVNGVTAANAQEREAYAHPKYISLIEKLRKVSETATLLKLQFKMKEWEIEVWRTKTSMKKAEMNLR